MPRATNWVRRHLWRAGISMLALFAAVTLTCSTKAPNKPLTRKACTKFGEQCEVSPGKLGSCVVRDNCNGTDCLVCQAQH